MARCCSALVPGDSLSLGAPGAGLAWTSSPALSACSPGHRPPGCPPFRRLCSDHDLVMAGLVSQGSSLTSGHQPRTSGPCPGPTWRPWQPPPSLAFSGPRPAPTKPPSTGPSGSSTWGSCVWVPLSTDCTEPVSPTCCHPQHLSPACTSPSRHPRRSVLRPTPQPSPAGRCGRIPSLSGKILGLTCCHSALQEHPLRALWESCAQSRGGAHAHGSSASLARPEAGFNAGLGSGNQAECTAWSVTAVSLWPAAEDGRALSIEVLSRGTPGALGPVVGPNTTLRGFDDRLCSGPFTGHRPDRHG